MQSQASRPPAPPLWPDFIKYKYFPCGGQLCVLLDSARVRAGAGVAGGGRVDLRPDHIP